MIPEWLSCMKGHYSQPDVTSLPAKLFRIGGWLELAILALALGPAALGQVRSAAGNISLRAEVAPRISLNLSAPSSTQSHVSIEQQTESGALLRVHLIGTGTHLIDVPVIVTGNMKRFILKARTDGEDPGPLIISLSSASLCGERALSRAVFVRGETVFGMAPLVRCHGIFAGYIRLELPAMPGEMRETSIRLQAVGQP